MNLNGHFSKAVNGNLTMNLPKTAEAISLLTCIRMIDSMINSDFHVFCVITQELFDEVESSGSVWIRLVSISLHPSPLPQVCVQPNTTQGYDVTETSMWKEKFSVGAKCAKAPWQTHIVCFVFTLHGMFESPESMREFAINLIMILVQSRAKNSNY